MAASQEKKELYAALLAISAKGQPDEMLAFTELVLLGYYENNAKGVAQFKRKLTHMRSKHENFNIGKRNTTKAPELVRRIETAMKVMTSEDIMTVRQIFYRLVTMGLIDKTDKEYGWVSDKLTVLRESKVINWRRIVDGTRVKRSVSNFNDVGTLFDAAANSFRTDAWIGNEYYVQVWCEKLALCGVIEPITSHYGVDLMIVRGQASVTFIAEAAYELYLQQQDGKTIILGHLGDHDPSGWAIAAGLKDRLLKWETRLDPDKLHVESIGITKEQVTKYNLQTRYTKSKDNNLKKWMQTDFAKFTKGESIEVDAIPARDLKAIISTFISRYIEAGHINSTHANDTEVKSQLREHSEGLCEYFEELTE